MEFSLHLDNTHSLVISFVSLGMLTSMINSILKYSRLKAADENLTKWSEFIRRLFRFLFLLSSRS